MNECNNCDLSPRYDTISKQPNCVEFGRIENHWTQGGERFEKFIPEYFKIREDKIYSGEFCSTCKKFFPK